MINVMEKTSNKNRGAEKGIALLMVIWIMTIMIVIVMAFSLTVRTNAFSTLAYKEAVARDFICEAGVQHAIMELFYRSSKVGRATTAAVTEEDYWDIDGTVYTEKIGDNEYNVRITDESGKIDINKADEILLRGLLVNLEIKEEDAETIADCIRDWRDPNSGDLHRLHGAGDEYYMSLPRPYKTKKADYDSLEELLLVKGVTSELLYGIEGKRKGLIDFLTVYSKDLRVNIDTAPKEVLMAIPGMSSENVAAVIEGRKGQSTGNAAVGIANPVYIKSGQSSNIFTIEVSPKNGDQASGYGTKAVVKIDNNNKKYTILYWKSLAPVTFQ